MEKRMAKGSLANAKLWLEKLQRNEDGVGVEELRTNPKYCKGYTTLLRRTKEAVEEVVTQSILSSVYKKDKNLVDEARSFLEKERKDGLFATAWNAAYETKNYLTALSAVYPEHLRFEHEVFQPYWLKHVHLLKNGRYYNDLYGVYWISTDSGEGCWQNDNFSLLGLPPTKELCDKFFEAEYSRAIMEAESAAA